MTAALIIVAALACFFGARTAVLAGRNGRQVESLGLLSAALAAARASLAECHTNAKEAWEARWEAGWQYGLGEARDTIGDAMREIPPLACGSERDGHLRLSEVLAVVRGEPVVVKRRKPSAVRVGGNSNGVDGTDLIPPAVVSPNEPYGGLPVESRGTMAQDRIDPFDGPGMTSERTEGAPEVEE